MINGPDKVKAYNLKFDKPSGNPYWNPYTDDDGQVFGR